MSDINITIASSNEEEKTNYNKAACRYFADAPDWVFNNEIVKQSICTKKWSMYGLQSDGTHGLLGLTINGPNGSQYTFKYRGIQFTMNKSTW